MIIEKTITFVAKCSGCGHRLSEYITALEEADALPELEKQAANYGVKKGDSYYCRDCANNLD